MRILIIHFLMIALVVLIGCTHSESTNNVNGNNNVVPIHDGSNIIEQEPVNATFDEIESTTSEVPASDIDMLIFNEAEEILTVSPAFPTGYRFIDLTADGIHSVFSRFMHFADLSLRGRILVRNDARYGFLVSSVTVHDDSSNVAIGFGQWHELTMFVDGYDKPWIDSEVHGIIVSAFSADTGHSDGVFFQAIFNMDDIPYMVTHWNTNVDEGKKRLTEVVNMLILYRPNFDIVFPGAKIVTSASD